MGLVQYSLPLSSPLTALGCMSPQSQLSKLLFPGTPWSPSSFLCALVLRFCHQHPIPIEMETGSIRWLLGTLIPLRGPPFCLSGFTLYFLCPFPCPQPPGPLPQIPLTTGETRTKGTTLSQPLAPFQKGLIRDAILIHCPESYTLWGNLERGVSFILWRVSARSFHCYKSHLTS